MNEYDILEAGYEYELREFLVAAVDEGYTEELKLKALVTIADALKGIAWSVAN